MNENNRDIPWVDGALLNENRNKFPREELLRYAGKHVAWSLDGTQILASGNTFAEVDKNLIAAGIDPSRVVHSYVPSPEEHTLL